MELTEKVLLNSGILEEFWNAELTDFKGSDKALEVVKEYIANIENARHTGVGLFIKGSNGTGKTYLSVCVLKEAIRKGFTAQMASLGGIIQALTDGWYDDRKRRDYEERIRNVDFLLIDDLGKELKMSKTGLTEIAFDNLIRYRTFRNKPTLFTTNLTEQDDIEKLYGRSLNSLLYGKCVPLKLFGSDYRKDYLSGTIFERLRGQAD